MVGGKRPYLQSPPVLGAVGGDDDAVFLGRPEPQRQSEVLAVFVHPVQEPQVGLPVETHGRLCQAQERGEQSLITLITSTGTDSNVGHKVSPKLKHYCRQLTESS